MTEAQLLATAASVVSDETSRANVSRGYMGNDAEWCYWDDEYSEDGSCGPFNTLGEAVMHASDAGYNEFTVVPETQQAVTVDKLDEKLSSVAKRLHDEIWDAAHAAGFADAREAAVAACQPIVDTVEHLADLGDLGSNPATDCQRAIRALKPVKP